MSRLVLVSLSKQRLYLQDNGIISQEYLISSARNGPGEQLNSGCTPRGWHYVRAKIGAQLPPQAVLAGRRPTGEIYSSALAARFPDRDWILSRILWLCGLELNFNRLGKVDTFRRYIYIHGSPDHLVDGLPGSCGCIRMHNADVIDLFDHIKVGTRVLISDSAQFPEISFSAPK